MPALRPVLLSLILLASGARADLGPLEPLADLHRAVRDSLGLPEPLIVQLLERGLPDEELPVVGLIAARASVPVDSVVTLRLGGMPYADLTLRFGLGPEIYHVPLEVDPGPPYGNAWGHFRETPPSEWRTLRLSDADIVNYANLRLCVDRYGVAPADVVALRKGGRGYGAIHAEIGAKGKPTAGAKPKGAKAKPPKPESSQAGSKSKGPKKEKPERPPLEPPVR